MEISQALWPCYKKFYKFMLLEFFANVVTHTKVCNFDLLKYLQDACLGMSFSQGFNNAFVKIFR